MLLGINSVNDSHFLLIKIKSNARLYEKLLLPTFQPLNIKLLYVPEISFLFFFEVRWYCGILA